MKRANSTETQKQGYQRLLGLNSAHIWQTAPQKSVLTWKNSARAVHIDVPVSFPVDLLLL